LPGASWIFTPEELSRAKAFLATRINDVPLPPDHGAPVRLIVPNWYGCCDIKWLNEIRFVDDNEQATMQMIEFAGRTHQEIDESLQKSGKIPAREFAPATMDLAAIPVRVEQWKLGGKLACRVIGFTWGGDRPSDKLSIRFGMQEEWQSVTSYIPKLADLPFGVWCHRWEPQLRGTSIQLSAWTRHPHAPLDSNWYARHVRIDHVS
jgi:DMSO/TMAO reductase YedYZ molybdopterin-dependent catalytic subunit